MAHNGGYSAFSAGPINDMTPKDPLVEASMGVPTIEPGILDSMTPYGPPYGVTASDESDFTKLEHKLAHKPGVTNPAGLAAKIGREELGQAEMTRRSVAGRHGG